MSDERVGLVHPETGGYFDCPAAAVPGWLALGWVPGDRPDEPNPAVAESLAWHAEQAAAAEQAVKAVKKSTKASRDGGSDTTPQE